MNKCLNKSQVVLAAFVLLALAFAGCPRHEETTLPPELSSGYNVGSESQLAPFVLADLEQIGKAALHQTHFNSGIECSTCHQDSGPIDHKLLTDQCIQCHSEELPTNGKLEYHCTACHVFSDNRVVLESAAPIRDLCLECHTEDEAGEDIYGYYSHAMKGDMSCSSCHRAHSVPQVFATDNCSVCHGEFLNNSMMKGGHTSCTICHRPHTWTADAETFDCTVCHSAPDTVLAHTLDIHPKQCTACHSPHFQDIKLEGGNCGICHENRQYTPGRNLPPAHNKCLNCHTTDNWGFKGSGACKSCHQDNGASIDSGLAPVSHTRCNTCHQPHTWRTSFNGCASCHDTSKVNEHLVEFHTMDCDFCHDPHFESVPPPTGHCSECHGDAVPDFQPASPPMHMNCNNCHTSESVESREFEFAGTEETCMVCHATAQAEPELAWSEVPDGHLFCTACHQQHQWTPVIGENSCGICHGDVIEAAAGNPMHSDCASCHTSGHAPQFVGVENSCQVCHSDAVAALEPFGKQDCSICHEQHTFKANLDNCKTCHGEPPGAHEGAGHQDCRVCHQTHTFETGGGQFCTTCHTDRAEHFPGNDCIGCHTFNE